MVSDVDSEAATRDDATRSLEVAQGTRRVARGEKRRVDVQRCAHQQSWVEKGARESGRNAVHSWFLDHIEPRRAPVPTLEHVEPR